MFIRLNKKGQSTLEYGVIIAVIVSALIIMQIYVKRGVQGRLRQASDDIGEQFTPEATGALTTAIDAASTEDVKGGVQATNMAPTTTTTVTKQQQIRTGTVNVPVSDKETWPK